MVDRNSAAQESVRDGPGPRRPKRANGVERYELLVAAAEHVLERDGIDALTIQRISREARVPMASVYHFFPNPGAAVVAIAERYLAGFAQAMQVRVPGVATRPWQEVVAILMRRTVRFYLRHPHAQRLFLGSDYSWQIRQADLLNNRSMATTIRRFVAPHFPHMDEQELLDAIIIAISIGDAVLALSVARHGTITAKFAEEAVTVVCGYLATKAPRGQPDGVAH